MLCSSAHTAHTGSTHKTGERSGCTLLNAIREATPVEEWCRAKTEQLDMRSASLIREVKKVGPSLKEVRVKMRKEWIPVWLQDPNKWRPGTKMPTFRLDNEEIQAISAFIWQSGVSGVVSSQTNGDPARGREAFETRGCMACHSMGEGTEKQGGTFAANLSRIGEKDNHDYLVRWIHNPRERTAPYCSFEKRDLTAERPTTPVSPAPIRSIAAR